MQQLVFAGPRSLEWREAPEPRLSSDAGRARASDRGRHLRPGRHDRRRAPRPSSRRSPSATSASPRSSRSATRSARSLPGRLVSVPFQISCGSCDACLRGTHLQLRRGAVHVDLRLRPGGGPLGRLPLRPGRASPSPSTCSCRCRRDSSRRRWRAPRTTSATPGGRSGPPLAEYPGADVLVVGGAGPGSIGLYAAGLAVALGSRSVLYVDGDDAAPRDRLARSAPRRWPRNPSASVPIRSPSTRARIPTGSSWRCARPLPTGSARARRSTSASSPRLPLLEMYTKGITFRTGRANARERHAPRARPGRRGPPPPRAGHHPRGRRGTRRRPRSPRTTGRSS